MKDADAGPFLPLCSFLFWKDRRGRRLNWLLKIKAKTILTLNVSFHHALTSSATPRTRHHAPRCGSGTEANAARTGSGKA